MLGSISLQLGYLFDHCWSMWTGMLGAIPYWDPYGAVTSLLLILTLAGYGVKTILDN